MSLEERRVAIQRALAAAVQGTRIEAATGQSSPSPLTRPFIRSDYTKQAK